MSLPDPLDAVARVPRRLVDFLRARLDEEILARGGGGHPGVALLRETVDDLAAGRPVPRYVVRILVLGYGRHPRFDPDWTDALDGIAGSGDAAERGSC